MNPLEYVLTRMKEIEPRFSELSRADKLEDEQRGEYDRIKTEWDELDERRKDLEERQLRATAAGNILVQAITLGHLPSLAAARQVVQDSTSINLEQPRDAAAWDSAYERFEKLCQR